ncbi:hypothetical protein BASA60_007253 [Batrachochytrium salamandrivorans]|nr:hypothetical protein BASA60_007253 [Batrachochytrium salamandrivorans]
MSSSPVNAQQPPQHVCWKTQKLSIKIIEAKYLDRDKSDGSCDFYCVARVDNNGSTEARTQTVFGSTSPFWVGNPLLCLSPSIDHFYLFLQVDLPLWAYAYSRVDYSLRMSSLKAHRGFQELKMVVWNENRLKVGADRPIGKITFPKQFLHGEDDQWYMLQAADHELASLGEVRVRIKHFPPKRRRQVHGFSVRIIAARNLYRRDAQYFPNPYAVFHMLPDPDAISTQQTRIQTRTNSPTFSETFFFTYNAFDTVERDLHCSIWDQGSLADGEATGFLGHISIPLRKVIQKHQINEWYWLNPISNDSGPSYTERRVRMRKKSLSEEEKRNRPRDLVKSLHKQEAVSPQTRKSHQFAEVGMAFSSCANCNGVMIGTHLQCIDCSVICHQKCKDLILPICGGVGAVRLWFKLTETIVMPLEYYSRFLTLLQDNSYFIPVILGKVSQDREDAARSLIRIFETSDTALRFLKAAVAHEILLAPDSRTLFRANSMASKAVDVFMKHIALKYLKSVLEGPILEIVQSSKSGELDPLRAEKVDKPEKGLQKNIEALMAFNTLVVDSILNSAESMPTLLRGFFWFLQETVSKKFENDPIVRYTCISGFIFLRFFAPAVLGPRLFGLDVGEIDSRSARNLLLVAKTLQNLSNLVEFGQKELYMAPMNVFIKNNMGRMKRFIESISRRPLLRERTMSHAILSELPALHDLLKDNAKESALIARECADLHSHMSVSLDKMIATDPTHPNLIDLRDTILDLDEKRRNLLSGTSEGDLDFTPWLSDNDLSDVIDEGTSPIDGDPSDTALLKEDEDERKIMRMLTRCSSTSMQSSLGSFRHSVDIRESIVKGSIKGEPSFPSTVITSMNISGTPAGPGTLFNSRSGLNVFGATHERQLLRMPGRLTSTNTANSAGSFTRELDLIKPSEELPQKANGPSTDKTVLKGASNDLLSTRTASDTSLDSTGKPTGSRSTRESLTSKVATGLGFINKLLFDGTLSADGGSTSDSSNNGERGSMTSFRRRARSDSPSQSPSMHFSAAAPSEAFNIDSPLLTGSQFDGLNDASSSVASSINRPEIIVREEERATSSHASRGKSTGEGLNAIASEASMGLVHTVGDNLLCGHASASGDGNGASSHATSSPLSMLAIPSNLGSSVLSTSLPSNEEASNYCVCSEDSTSSHKQLHRTTPDGGGSVMRSISRKGTTTRKPRRRTLSASPLQDDMTCVACGLKSAPDCVLTNRSKSAASFGSDLVAMMSGIVAGSYTRSSSPLSSGQTSAAPGSPGSKFRLLQKSQHNQTPSLSDTVSPVALHTNHPGHLVKVLSACSLGPPFESDLAGTTSISSEPLASKSTMTRTSRSKSSTLKRATSQSPQSSQLTSVSVCHRCTKEISDAVLEAGGKRYHPHCLSCALCKIPLTSSLIPSDNDVICRECYLRQSGLICGICSDLIYAEYLVVNNANFHVACRKCDTCGSALSGKEHFTLGDQVFCSDHRDSIITCHACHQRIDGEVLIACDPQKFFHLNHFNCGGCGKDLSATVFYEMGDRMWCQPCFLDHGDRFASVGTVDDTSAT